MTLDPNAKKSSVKTKVNIPIANGTVGTFVSFNNLSDDKEHIALCFGEFDKLERPLVRVHSECLTGDIFGSLKCDCGPQLKEAISLLSKEGGILIYLRQEGRNIGLYNKLQAYAFQDEGMNTYDANNALGFENDLRDYTVAGQMLQSLDIKKITLLTNNPDKVSQMRKWVDVVPKQTSSHLNCHNKDYLEAKVQVTNHNIPL